MVRVKSPAETSARDVERLAASLESAARALRAEAERARRNNDERAWREERRKALNAAADAIRAGGDDDAAFGAAWGATLFFAPDVLAEIVRAARHGAGALARAERDRAIMVAYRRGRTNAEISAEFGISKSRVSRILTQAKRLK